MIPRATATRRLLLPVVAFLLPLLWTRLHPPVPLGPDADHYTALSVAEHLRDGDGFLNGIVYPVSLSFPFAARVPQPLIERPWGVPLLSLPAVVTAGGDPAASLAWTRRWWLAWLGLLAAAGTALLWRRGLRVAPWIWLAGLAVSPLLAMTVQWRQVELPAALLLLLLWGRTAGAAPATPPASPGPDPAAARRTAWRRGGGDGLLWAALTGLRGELFWLPPLWLALAGPGRRPDRRRWLAAVTVWLVLTIPWGVRNLRVTGSPWFTLQAWTEHLKETPDHPGYSIYTEPRGESLLTTLRHRPRLVVAKTVAGLKYYLRRTTRWLEPAVWIWLVLAALLPGTGRRRAALLLVTTGALTILYAPFSHTLRYMVMVLPLLLLEGWSGIEAAARAVAGHDPAAGRARIRGPLVLVAAAGLLLAGGVPTRLAGWERAAGEARAGAARLGPAVAAARHAPPGPLFSDSAAALWLAGRDGVWWPGPNPPPAWLATAVPELAGAPWIRLAGAAGSVDQGEDQPAQQADRQGDQHQ